MKKRFNFVLIFVVALLFSFKVTAAETIVSGFPASISATYSGTVTMPYGTTIMNKFYNNAGRAFCTAFWYNAPTGTCSAIKWNSDATKNKKIAVAIGAMINKTRTLTGNTEHPNSIGADQYFYGEMAINNFLYNYNGKNSINNVSSLAKWSTISANATYKSIYSAGVTAYNNFNTTTMQISDLTLKVTNKTDTQVKVKAEAKVTCYNKDGKTVNCSAPCSKTLTIVSTQTGETSKTVNDISATCTRKVQNSTIYYEYKSNEQAINRDKTKAMTVKATVSLKNKVANPVAQNYNCGSNKQSLTPNLTYTLYTYNSASKSKSTTINPEEEPDEPTPECKIKFMKVDGNETPLKGAKFELYESKLVDDHYEVGNKIDTAFSDSNGNVIFDGLVPSTKYYYKEVTPPKGYKLNSAFQEINTNQESGSTCADKVDDNFVNNKETGSIVIKKTDGPNGTGNFVKGAKIKVYTVTEKDADPTGGDEVMDVSDSDSEEGGEYKIDDNNTYDFNFLHFDNNGNRTDDTNANDYFITDGNAKTISGLALGETYYIYEDSVPENSDYAIKVGTDSVLIEEAKQYTVNLQNIHSSIKISKQAITGKKELPGATLQILDSRGLPVEIDGEKAEWVSTTTPKEIKGLEDGVYKLVEITAPKGYAQAESIEFTIENGKLKNDDDNILVMYDDVLKVEVPDTLSARNILIVLFGIGLVAGGMGVFLYGVKRKDEV